MAAAAAARAEHNYLAAGLAKLATYSQRTTFVSLHPRFLSELGIRAKQGSSSSRVCAAAAA